MNSRWLGGMLTNWKTIPARSRACARSTRSRRRRPGPHEEGAPPLAREKEKLERALGGIKDMGGTPDLIFVIDTNKEQLAIQEAKRLGIPVAAIVDTNCDPTASPSRFRPMTTPAARSRSTAIWSPAPPSTASPAALAPWASISASPRTRWLKSSRRTIRLLRPAKASSSMSGCSARRSGRSDQAQRRRPQLEKKLNEAGIFHYWQLAAMQPGDVAQLDKDLKLNGRLERDGWINQCSLDDRSRCCVALRRRDMQRRLKIDRARRSRAPAPYA